MHGARSISDWYARGVVVICRWMATAVVRPPSVSAAVGEVAGLASDDHRA